MPFGLPARDEANWDTKLNDSINAVKATADAAETPTGAQAKADAAEAAAVADAAATYVPLTQAATSAQQGIVELATTAETATGTDATRAVTPAGAAATFAGLAAAVNNFTGKIEIDGGFTNALDSDLWVAGPIRNNPTADTEGIFVQHRVMGNLGGQVHDGVGAEVRVTSGTNATAVCGLETTAELGGAGTNLGDVRSITSNFVFDVGLTGTLTAASVIRTQTLPALPAGFTIGTVYSLYVEPQTVGSTNWSIYAPTGTSKFGPIETGNVTMGGASTAGISLVLGTTTGTNPAIYWQKGGNNRWINWTTGSETGANAGSDLTWVARDDSGNSIGTALTITRSTLWITTGSALKVGGNIGFYGTTPVAKPTVSGSRGGNAALDSLLTALASQGLITNSSTA